MKKYTIKIYFGFIKKVQGLGIHLDTDAPMAMDKTYWVLRIDIIWFRFWMSCDEHHDRV